MNFPSECSFREYLAYDLGIIIESDMTTDEMKEEEIKKLALRHKLTYDELKNFHIKLDDKWTEELHKEWAEAEKLHKSLEKK